MNINIPWKKLGSWALIAIAGVSAVMDAVSKNEQETKLKNMEKDLEMLKAKAKDS